jgi:ribulose-phosphate 3-epimerase
MLIIPAILETTLDEVKSKIDLLKNDSKKFHIDIMDSTITPERSIPIHEIPMIPEVKYELHLMVKKPSEYIVEVRKIKPYKIIIHSEIPSINSEIEKVRGLWDVYVAIDITTSAEQVIPMLKKVNGVLVMSVPIGKTGQKFHKEALNKIKYLSKYTKNIEIDGGVNLRNISQCAKLNVSEFAISSGIYKGHNPKSNLTQLKKIVRRV